MSQTTYYELNKPTGSDLVNLLTDTFPNWDIVDNVLHELDTRSICNATETVSLGVHAISRLNTNTKFIKWIATANFTAGDTFTVDGDVVAASTPGGATLGTNAYVTGAVVVACLNADNSAMTVYVTGVAVADDANKLGGQLPAYYATQSDMSAAQTDIGNIKALDGTTSIVGIGDGTLTGAISALNNDLTDITPNSTYQYQGVITPPVYGSVRCVVPYVNADQHTLTLTKLNEYVGDSASSLLAYVSTITKTKNCFIVEVTATSPAGHLFDLEGTIS